MPSSSTRHNVLPHQCASTGPARCLLQAPNTVFCLVNVLPQVLHDALFKHQTQCFASSMCFHRSCTMPSSSTRHSVLLRQCAFTGPARCPLQAPDTVFCLVNVLPQVLHDAFFKYQTKPRLTQLGEMYYEGKEFEARVENAKPGILSDDLKK